MLFPISWGRTIVKETDRCGLSSLDIRARNSRNFDSNCDSFEPSLSSCDCGSQFIKSGSINMLGQGLVKVRKSSISNMS